MLSENLFVVRVKACRVEAQTSMTTLGRDQIDTATT